MFNASANCAALLRCVSTLTNAHTHTDSDQGALAQLPQLCQQASQRLQQLQQVLRQLVTAGGSSCEGAGGEQWQQQVAQLEEALQRSLQEMQAFDLLYDQVCLLWVGFVGVRCF